MTYRVHLYTVGGLMLFLGAFVFAQEPELPQYRVEYIILRHLEPVSGTEIWPVDDDADEEEEIPAERFAAIPADELTLSEMAARVANARNTRVLYHGGWDQPGYSREDARRKLIQRSSLTGESVSGSFTLQLERYLRLVVDLTLEVDGERYRMQPGRRMISRQTHYFDHPYFGVIARITPL